MGIPKIIVLATGKGGAGKSTIARSLAAHWFCVGLSPALVDADPQGSIINLHDVEGPMSSVPVVSDPEVETIAATIEELAERHDVVIVDTAGFRNKTMIMASISADMVLIPVKPSAEDVREAVATYDLVQELNETPERKGNPISAFLVLSMSQQNTVIARHVRSELEKGGYPIMEAEIAQRVIYPELSMKGLAPSITEPDSVAAREIANLATEIGRRGGVAHVKAA